MGDNGSQTFGRSALGRAIARSGKGVIYGGGNGGLMGAVSGSALEAGAPVIGTAVSILRTFLNCGY